MVELVISKNLQKELLFIFNTFQTDSNLISNLLKEQVKHFLTTFDTGFKQAFHDCLFKATMTIASVHSRYKSISPFKAEIRIPIIVELGNPVHIYDINTTIAKTTNLITDINTSNERYQISDFNVRKNKHHVSALCFDLHLYV